MKKMFEMKYAAALVVLPLLAAGCVRSHRYSDVVYRPVPSTTVVTPTSPAPAVRVYPETTPPVTSTAPVTVPVNPSVAVVPSGVSPSDVALADSIRSVVQDNTMVAGMNNVQITVQNGVVTVNGTSPSEHARTQLEDRLERIPGVDRVINRLRVDMR